MKRRLGLLGAAVVVLGVLTPAAANAAPSRTAVSVAAVQQAAPQAPARPLEHGGPGDCGPQNDGAKWYDEWAGYWLQCQYRGNGRWGWVIIIGEPCHGSTTAVAADEKATPATHRKAMPACS